MGNFVDRFQMFPLFISLDELVMVAAKLKSWGHVYGSHLNLWEVSINPNFFDKNSWGWWG